MTYIKMKENEFRDRFVLPLLQKFPKTKYIIKQANSLRGIPDLICCINGKYVEFEVKKSVKELEDYRHKLQEYEMDKTWKANGIAFTIYPENYKAIMFDVISECFVSDEECKLKLLLDEYCLRLSPRKAGSPHLQ